MMPDSPKPDITAFIGLIKAELSEHCLKLMERMDSCYEIEKAELTEHANEEIARLCAVGKDVEETIQETFVEDLVDAKKEIARMADKENPDFKWIYERKEDAIVRRERKNGEESFLCKTCGQLNHFENLN